MNSQFDKEMEHLEDQLDKGEITRKEFDQEVRELQWSYQATAEEAAQSAYDDVMNDYFY